MVDSLAPATPETIFLAPDSGGIVITGSQTVGPAFRLSEPGVLNEVGAFLHNSGGFVEIRPELDGAPDPNVVIAQFPLSDDGDPQTYSYESARFSLPLEPGLYFALFTPREPALIGVLLTSATFPFIYRPSPFLHGIFINGTFHPSIIPSGSRVLINCVQPVAIDIRPGNRQNNFHPGSRGVLPVAILTTGTFDAGEVDPDSLRLGAQGTEAEPVRWFFQDVDHDGDLDLVVHFRIDETGLTCRSTVARLTGMTGEGSSITGSDAVKAVGCR